MNEIKERLTKLQTHYEQGNFCYAELLNHTMQLTGKFKIESIISQLSKSTLLEIRRHASNLIDLADNIDESTQRELELWISKIDDELNILD